jgi:hypothetical protein
MCVLHEIEQFSLEASWTVSSLISVLTATIFKANGIERECRESIDTKVQP